ncbi:serine/threonine-protein kinase, partial [Jiangella rhizosphaerae]
MTTMRVTWSGGGASIGAAPEHPERTALVEAAGALLTWDVVDGSTLPSATVHDPERAAGWLWEVYGPEAAAVLLAGGPGTSVVEVAPAAPDVADAAYRLAWLTWAEAWWPASYVADVPPLDPYLLSAERALTAHAVEHLLDDDEAVERALHAAVRATPAARPSSADTPLAEHRAVLLARLAELGDAYGIAVPEPAAGPAAGPRPPELALAAGAPPEPSGTVVQSGSAVVDWSLVPPGVVDAAAAATWTVRRRDDATVLEVGVAPAPRPVAAELRARFGPADLPLRPDGDGGPLLGTAPLPPAALLLPAAQRVA